MRNSARPLVVAIVAFAVVCSSGCEARLILGGACARSGECPSPLVCTQGRCRSECTEHRDCSLGARCVLEAGGSGTCSLPDDPDCRALGNECQASLLCLGGDCVNACTSATTCPADSVCTLDAEGRAYCERADVDASGPFDAGPTELDAPATDVGDAAAAPCTPPTCDPVARVAVVPSGSCAMTSGGAVWCWGHEGSLGVDTMFSMCASGATPCSPTPVRVRLDHAGVQRDVEGASSISGGRVLSVIEGGRLYSWGGTFRTLGALRVSDLASAVRVEPGSAFLPANVAEVDSSWTAAYARMASGELYMWGDEDYGQRGAGVGAGSDFAELDDPLPGGTGISLGGWHGCGLLAGSVMCWGENDVGQAGVPTGGPVVDMPTVVAGVPTGATEVVAGRGHGCALASGVVYCWGYARSIGTRFEPPGCVTGTSGQRACPAVPIVWGGAPFVGLFSGGYSEDTCAITALGELYCWGANSGVEPTRSTVPPPVTHVALGDLHVCAITAGDVWCWGGNGLGQLGRGSADTSVHLPGPVVWP